MLKFLLILLIGVGFYSHAQVNELWNSRFNGSGNGIDQPVDLVIDGSGNTFITGISYSSNGDYDVLTLKYNSSGVLQWSNSFGGNGLDEPHAMALDQTGNVIVVGSKFISGNDWDIFTLKINGSTGNQIWANTYTGSALFDTGKDVIIDAANNVYVAGGYYVTSTKQSHVLIKYNAAGVQQWTNVGDPSTNDSGSLLSFNAAGEIVLVGAIEFSVSTTYFDIKIVKISTSGATIWTKTIDSGYGKLDKANALSVDAFNNIYIGGSGFTNSTNLEDYFLVKLNNSGTLQWQKLFSGNAQANDYISSMAINPSNQDIYVTGKLKSAGSAENIHTRAYSSAGNLLWEKTYSSAGSNLDAGTDIAYKNNAIYVTGHSFKTSQNNNYTTIKYSNTGSQVWVKHFNYSANASDKAYKLVLDNQDNIIITGASYTSAANNLDMATIKYCQLETIAVNDTAICNGSSVNLSANAIGGLTYEWSIVSGEPASPITISCTSCQQTTVSPTVTTTYAVSSQNAIGCIDYDTVIVTVNHPSVPQITNIGNLNICTGDSIKLQVNNENYVNYLWSTGQTSNQITINTANTFNVTITDTNGCVNTNAVTTTLLNLPNINAGNDVGICLGQSKQLLASGGISYVWNTNSTLNQFNIANPIANPTTTNTYIVTGTDANNCKNKDTITVTVNPNPSITTSANATICAGDSIQIIASGTQSYSWNNANTLSNANIPNPYAHPSQLTNYTVTGTNQFGCTAQKTVTISTNSLPNINAGNDQTICAQDSAHIFVTGGYNYNWAPTTTLSSLTSTNPWASPLQTTTYIVTGHDANNCKNKDTITIYVNDLPIISAGNDLSICQFTSAVLNASGAVSYVWNPNPTLSGTNTFNPTVTPNVQTSYVVNGTNNNGCSNRDTIIVSVNPLPNISAGQDFSVCIGDSATLNPSGGVSYIWSPHPTLSDINNPNTYVTPLNTSNYTVTGTDANGCQNQDAVTVGIFSLPSVFAGNDITVCEQENAQLQASGALTFAWDASIYLTNINIFNPSTINLNQTNWFYVTGTDSHGCKNRDSVKITVNPLPAPPTILAAFPNLISSYVFGNTWYINNTIDPNLNNDTINYVNHGILGNFSVTHTDFNGCTSHPSSYVKITTLEDTTLSIHNYSIFPFDVNIYPNPTQNDINIASPQSLDQVVLFDVNGRIIYVENKISSGIFTFNMEALRSGTYYLKIVVEDQQLIKQIIKH